MTPQALGYAIALCVFVVDQATKAAVLSRFSNSAQEPSPLAPFLDLALRWNHGISFSLFAHDSPTSRVVLLAITVAAIGLLSLWLSRCRSHWAAVGLGAIIGGALGNAFDRMIHGGVVDFLDLHAFDRHFFVFNLADTAINVGVVLLIVDLMFVPRAANRPNRSAAPPEAR